MLIRYGKEQNGKLKKKAVVYTQDEHKINAADVDNDAVFITGRLRANGYESYIVGGAVRDLILGKKPKDFDIVTNAAPARIKRIFRNSRIIGRRFRLVHVFFGSRIFEVSTFRSQKDSHAGNTYGTIEEDVLRRDFTFNALFYDPGRQIVVDYVNGMIDIRKRLLQPIMPVELIFKDDPVRMIRAVKYAAAGGFSVPRNLERRIRKEAPLLGGISPSRLTEEMSKIIRSPAAALIVENLEKTGLYGFLQKEAADLMRNNSAFRSAYLKSLAGESAPAAKQSGVPSGRQSGKPNSNTNVTPNVHPLIALIRDYLELITPWQELQKGTWEECRDFFISARRFILPMNPPRVELEKAVRLVFAEHGIVVKKTRPVERRHERKNPAWGKPAK
ncbi:MAG: polynucleotide adenylyltransferase PcnB [Spirochaetaceae bacterium]|jgi:poly(A) polymerase|nr:polynucleotide adenylyltransferase PcnB [Spirochaetaceae bacterium]